MTENNDTSATKTSLAKKLTPLIKALDTFILEPKINTKCAPHIRDAIDLKRWMVIVVFALVPCILMAIWNNGVQSLVFGSFSEDLMLEYIKSSQSFSGYFKFCFTDYREFEILKLGSQAFLPVMFLCYLVGGFWEVLFACIRGHEVSEGFLVTGMLIALILPPTIPYWMVIVGVSAGVILGKELFGGTGMNILNPALTARCFLFFTFPTKMTGDIWIGTNPTTIQKSLNLANSHSTLPSVDGFSGASALNLLNITSDIKRVHVDAIGMFFGKKVSTLQLIAAQFNKWKTSFSESLHLDKLSLDQLQEFITTPLESGGLGLSPENFSSAFQFAKLKFSQGILSDGNFFFGNMIGSMGETCKFGILLGLILLLVTKLASWRTVLAMLVGGLGCAFLFQYGSEIIGTNHGAWNPAKFALPAYKHLLLGSFAFGLVYMATEPVTSPNMSSGKWVYGILVGAVVIVIRLINPAFPEGVMLAILFGNVFSPLIDHYALKQYRKVRRVRAKKILQK